MSITTASIITTTTSRRIVKEPTVHPLGNDIPCPVIFEDIYHTLKVICKHPSHNDNNSEKGGQVTNLTTTDRPTNSSPDSHEVKKCD
jgi:hypothetical protein